MKQGTSLCEFFEEALSVIPCMSSLIFVLFSIARPVAYIGV